jgi:hypothetical protein
MATNEDDFSVNDHIHSDTLDLDINQISNETLKQLTDPVYWFKRLEKQ